MLTLAGLALGQISRPAANSTSPNGKTADEESAELRSAVERFIAAADRGDLTVVAAVYTEDFASVRVADEGGFVQLTRDQMLAFMQSAVRSSSAGGRTAPAISTQTTTIHHVEVLGDTGYVLLTRIKNIGNGWEPMFYTLIWKKQDKHWRLLREFVHQKTIPRQTPK